MDNSDVKENIFKYRRASGLSQTAMADKIGLSRTAYRNIEFGRTKIISDKLDVIASSLDTTPEVLLLGYQPSEGDSRKLKDVTEKYQIEKRKIETDYESKIEALNRQIESLEGQIDALKETVQSKDEIISMIKKNRL